ncbi:MAG: nicotinate-nucleotide--dimethylbenzimidazole phosphoribosyltransferase [Pseudobacteriovorax sp.]|nr:nicotinate-nucleotide--dimethylbenzimidazole phosphoribosyltransferase [Pseudobacteriovorax sp.]
MIPNIKPIDKLKMDEITNKIDHKTKPLGSLGRLEELAIQLAQILGSEHIDLRQPKILLFAGDHGLTEEGISPYPQVVTQQMIQNFVNGGAAINVFSRQHQIALDIVDCGLVSPTTSPEVVNLRLGSGTQSSLRGSAMTKDQYQKGLENGKAIARKAIDNGTTILGFGEMGIGNSSIAALLAAKLIDCDITLTAGRGTGCDDEQMNSKLEVLKKVLTFHESLDNHEDIICALGGFEQVTALGAILEACSVGIPVMIDGFIMSSVALCAAKLAPHSLDYMIFTHKSASPGHQVIMEHLGKKPLIDLGMRLGEGSGVAVAWPIIQSSAAFYNEMASFADANVSTTDA